MKDQSAAAAALGSTSGKILADDTDLYPMVYMMRKPERFILPYRYEFVTALSNPGLMTEYVVMRRGSERDLVFQKYGTEIKGFHTFFEDGSITILKKNRTALKPS